jgi:hypothetical protein
MIAPMRRSPRLWFLAFAFTMGCRSSATPAVEQTAQKSAPAVSAVAPSAAPAGEHKRFGEPINPGAAIALGEVLAKPDDFANRSVTIEAKVRRNCTRRGCWMELAQTLDPALPGCRVTFKDYGFFVPLDSAGSTAKVQGTVEVTRVAPEEVAHLESEGARFASKQPDGTAREVRVVASGVELWREPS